MKNRVTAIAAQGRFIFVGLGNGTIQVWDEHSLRKEDEFVAHDGAVRSLFFQNEELVSVGARGSTAQWRNGKLVKRHRLKDSHLNDGLILPDGRLVVAADRGQIAALTGTDRWHLRGLHGRAVFHLAYSQTHQILYSVGTDGTIGRVNVKTGEVLKPWRIAKHWVHCVDYLNDQLWIGDANGSIAVIDPLNGSQMVTLKLGSDRLVKSTVSGKFIVYGTESGWVYLVNHQNQKVSHSIRVGSEPILGLWAAKERLIVGGNGTAMRIYDDYDTSKWREFNAGGR